MPSTLTSMDRIPIAVRMDGLALLDSLTILTRVISMGRLTGNDRQEGVYRLTGMATDARLRRMVIPASRHISIRG